MPRFLVSRPYTMYRVTAPLSKIARALSSSPSAPRALSATPILDSSTHSAGASLMPKYAELLHNRRSHDHLDSHRGLATAHRPTPQPSLTDRTKPLMQTFHSSTPSSMHTSATHIDATVLPLMSSFGAPEPDHGPRVPLLPDNYAAAHSPGLVVSEATAIPEVTIVAANPDNVVPGAPNAAVEGIGFEGIELKFLYDERSQQPEEPDRGGMVRDIWKGMIEDIFGEAPKKVL